MIERIKGDYLVDGYLQEFSPQHLDIIIIDGVAYSATSIIEYGIPANEAVIDLISNTDELMAWGASTSFLPNAGELDRIGRHLFRVV